MIVVPEDTSVVVNPSHEDLQAWALELMPRVTKTEFGNINYQSKITARLKGSNTDSAPAMRISQIIRSNSPSRPFGNPLC